MKIKNIGFRNFRSFGPRNNEIDLHHKITYFVGKNHTSKSNLYKILKEMKFNNMPINKKYILSKSNWFNYETGVEKPLKLKFRIDLPEKLYQYLIL